jgi:peptidyl-prolyl cis-trans isomerase C
MKLRTLTLALGLSSLLAGCDQVPTGNSDTSATSTPAAINDTSAVVATVNGAPITESVIELYQEQMQINLELASQSGTKAGLDKDARLQLQIDQQRRAVVATAAIQSHLDSNPVTDEELKKLYDEQVPKGSEYKARHILLEDEEAAKKLVTELDGGADFSELAKQHSTGPSGKSGGELGWFSPKQMVAPFSEAAAKLEKGGYTKEPVKTQFGWHIIILDDVRESTPPDFEQVKPQLQSFVQKQRVQDFINSLRQGASIEMKAAPVATEPATPDAEPASSGSGEGYPK